MTALETKPIEFRPQDGPQMRFAESEADIVIFGGSAGGGKTLALLLEPLRHLYVPGSRAIIFRRNSTDIRNPGGMWDQASTIYPNFGAIGSASTLKWVFPSGSVIKMNHLEDEKSKLSHQGAQYSFIGFDELTHFGESSFWYLLSRNRSWSAGLKPYIRATCNPDPDHFVRKLIDWWIDNDTGLPIPERDAVLRWFVRPSDELVWGDSRGELIARFGDKSMPKSLTFIRATLQSNKIFTAADPGYESNLKALPKVDRDRLLYGNWNARASSGEVFRREWFEVIEHGPAFYTGQHVRYWDRAATAVSAASPDPDWTVGVKMLRTMTGQYVIEDVVRLRGTPAQVEDLIRRVASQDGPSVVIGIEQDPGQAGVAEAGYYVKALSGYSVATPRVITNKLTRAKPLSSQAEHGNVKLLRGRWNEDFLNELHNFAPEGDQVGHDDQVDAASGAFTMLTPLVQAMGLQSYDFEGRVAQAMTSRRTAGIEI
jgi:predicted phage terminase large subunit-like protein